MGWLLIAFLFAVEYGFILLGIGLSHMWQLGMPGTAGTVLGAISIYSIAVKDLK